jgi:regulator of sirC expression with transglutaminase-like and TPR domain
MSDPITYLGLVDDEDIQLDLAALDLSALDHPGIDLAPYHAVLDEMGERLARVGAQAETVEEQRAALAQVIADEFGFEGDRTQYDAPVNADLIRVIDRRSGLPVSLSILYVALARRMDWEADALNVPGHVLVLLTAGGEAMLVDAFSGGAPVAVERMQALVDGSAMPAAMSNRMVLVRLLLNQATRAEQAGDVERATTLYERMTIFAPSEGVGWWEHARLRLHVSDVSGAKQSLSAMLEVTREPQRRRQIVAALEAIA